MRLRILGNREKPIDRILKNILLLNVRSRLFFFRPGTQQAAHAVRQLGAGRRHQEREGAGGGHHRLAVPFGHRAAAAGPRRNHAGSADGRVSELSRGRRGLRLKRRLCAR